MTHCSRGKLYEAAKSLDLMTDCFIAVHLTVFKCHLQNHIANIANNQKY